VARFLFRGWLLTFYPPSLFLRGLILFLIVNCFIAHLGLAESPVDTDAARHFLFAAESFSAGIGYQVALLCGTARSFSATTVIRCVLIAVGISFLLLCAKSDKFFDKREEDTVSMIGEWAYLLELELFYATVSRDLTDIRVIAIVAFD
jgi:hypothetical protein